MLLAICTDLVEMGSCSGFFRAVEVASIEGGSFLNCCIQTAYCLLVLSVIELHAKGFFDLEVFILGDQF
ncbi:hypothetical protein BL248_01850 [Ralstonia solanacearum]|nr:hypothetical protein BL248_01850 [Ralstonia solanacearum]